MFLFINFTVFISDAIFLTDTVHAILLFYDETFGRDGRYTRVKPNLLQTLR